VPRARWDSVLFRRPDPDVTGRACLLWTVPVLALALLLGAACSDDGNGTGGDAAADRPADTSPGEVFVDRLADAGPDTLGPDLRADASPDAAPGDAADAGGDAAAAAPLCDGSAGPRLIHINTGGGPLWPTFSFSGAYGHAFFVIDGTCHYWVGQSYLEGIRAGVLTPARADQIAADLHVAAFARLKDVGSLAAPDASTRVLSDGVNAIRCTGDCTRQAPNAPTPLDFQQAFQRLQGVLEDLFTKGTPATLPIRVIATEPDFDSAQPVAWPLTWSPSEILVGGLSNPPPGAGRLITSGSELTALRQLRQAAADRNATNFGIKVRDAADKQFLVLPRDEAPAAVVQALAPLH
jgi:hypothetical protein